MYPRFFEVFYLLAAVWCTFFVKCNMKSQVSDFFISQDAFNLAGSKNAVIVIEKQAKKHAFRKNRWLVMEAVAALLESLVFFKSIPI